MSSKYSTAHLVKRMLLQCIAASSFIKKEFLLRVNRQHVHGCWFTSEKSFVRCEPNPNSNSDHNKFPCMPYAMFKERVVLPRSF